MPRAYDVQQIIDDKIKYDDDMIVNEAIRIDKYNRSMSQLFIDKILYIIDHVDYYYDKSNERKEYKIVDISYNGQTFMDRMHKYICCLNSTRNYFIGDKQVQQFIEQFNVDNSNIKIVTNGKNIEYVSRVTFYVDKKTKCMKIHFYHW